MSAGKIQQLLMEGSNDGGLAPASGIPALAPRVRQLRDYWESKQRGRAMPARADINPCEIKPLLPYLMISDLFGDPPRVRFRLPERRSAKRSDSTSSGAGWTNSVSPPMSNSGSHNAAA